MVKSSELTGASNPETSRSPFDARELLHLPDPNFIESQAFQLLTRALHSSRLTAFVGSGASMAYGRISWSDMLYTTQRAVLERSAAITGGPRPRIDALLRSVQITRDSGKEASRHG